MPSKVEFKTTRLFKASEYQTEQVATTSSSEKSKVIATRRPRTMTNDIIAWSSAAIEEGWRQLNAKRA